MITTWSPAVGIDQAEEVIREPKDFIAWLEALPRTAPVGTRRACTDCPVSRYLSVRLSARYAVDPARVTIQGAGPQAAGLWCITPDWAARFIRKLDRDRSYDHFHVNAGECLDILHDMYEEDSVEGY